MVMPGKLKTIELFAGVGGFRLGLEGPPEMAHGSKFKVIWSNQWEPNCRSQHAANVYNTRWNCNSHLDNRDINEVINNDFDAIPDHQVLTAGFPCQDYSVARPLSQAAGLQGKKGILWWCIYEIIRKKKNKPKYLILENVDRLVKSPADQRGRDFAIMLSSLAEQEYAVEWRIINAAEYGFPQRRRRVFILAYHKTTSLYKKMASTNPFDWIVDTGVLAKAFPACSNMLLPNAVIIDSDPVRISRSFGTSRAEKSPFLNAGSMLKYDCYTADVKAIYNGPYSCLGDSIQDPNEIDESFYIRNGTLAKWRSLKGAKSVPRKAKNGHSYCYSEGSMVFPDPIEKPARTIITGEGGATPSRFKHVIEDARGLRRLTPIELERLNGFPDDHTAVAGISDIKRAFMMGNALVVGVIKKIGNQLVKEI